MALKFSSKGGDFKGVPAGNYIAICNLVADLGLQPGSGMYPDPKFQVYIRFEIPAERVKYTDKQGVDREGPRVIGNAYTASMGKKANLRKQLEGWRGRVFTDDEASNFDVSTILGKACMLNVVEKESNGKTYSNIGSISALPKGMPTPQAENPLLYYAQDDTSMLEKLPEWIRKMIENPAEQETSHATGVYAEPDQGGHYDFDQQQVPIDAYENQHGVEIDDSDIPF